MFASKDVKKILDEIDVKKKPFRHFGQNYKIIPSK